MQSRKLEYILYIATGILMSFFTITGNILTHDGNIVWTGYTIFKILVISVAFGTAFGFIITWLFDYFKRALSNRENSEPEKIKAVKPIYVFLTGLILILISFVPFILAYFPGILSYDAPIQIGQVLSGQYNDHHPLVHTLLIKLCLDIGKALFGNMNAGIVIYTLLQSILFAVTFAEGVKEIYVTFYKKNLLAAYVFSALTLVICMFFRFNGYMAVTLTKDCLFSVFFLAALLLFVRFFRADTIRKKRIILLLLGATYILCELFRNNARYACLGFGLIMGMVAVVNWIKYRKHRTTKKAVVEMASLTAMFIVVFIVGSLILSLTGKVLNATQGDRREMLSVPIQQFARCAMFHSGEGIIISDDGSMKADTKAVVDEFLLDGSFKLYNPYISDPVKRHTNTYVARYRTKEFVTAYCDILKSYPGDCINAFIALNNGFLNITDRSHAVINQLDNNLSGHGYVQTRWDEYIETTGITKSSILPKLYEHMEKWADGNEYLDVAIINIFYMPGIYLWICIFAFVTFILIPKKRKFVIPIGFALTYAATMLFGPTVQLRYIYPFMVFVLFLLPIALGQNFDEDSGIE